MPVLTEELARLKKDPSGRKGHRWQISCLGFSPDGSSLASGSWDKEIRVWDLSNLETKLILKGLHKVPVTSLSWQKPSGRLLCAGSADCTASLWSIDTGKHIGTLSEHNSWILDASFSLVVESLLATASWDGSVKLWDIETRRVTSTFTGHEKGVWSVDFKPVKGSAVLCSASEDGSIKLWDTRNRKAVRTFEGGHCQPIYSIAWSADGSMVASGSEDTKICIWEPGSGALINTIQCHSDNAVKSVHFNPQTINMSLPVLVSAGGFNVNISDPRPSYKANIISLSLHDIGKEVEAVTVSPDGTLIASGGRDGNIILMTLMVPRVVPSFSGRGNVMDKQRKIKKHSFIKDITHIDEDDEDAVEELNELDDILSSPLQQEVEQNVSRLKRLGRTATKEVELQDHSTIKKNVNARSSRKKRATEKDIDLPTMVAHLTSRPAPIEEKEEEKGVSSSSSSEEEEELLLPTPPPPVTIDKSIVLSDTTSESDGVKFSNVFDDTSEAGTDDPEAQFLEGGIPQSSTLNSLHVSSTDGNYSMLDHLDSSILLTKQKKKTSKKRPIVEGIPEDISVSAISIGTASAMDIEQRGLTSEDDDAISDNELTSVI